MTSPPSSQPSFPCFLPECPQDISELEGLEECLQLEKLWLSENQLVEIKGLSQLVNLRELYLHSNRIRKIQGLDTLKRLEVQRSCNRHSISCHSPLNFALVLGSNQPVLLPSAQRCANDSLPDACHKYAVVQVIRHDPTHDMTRVPQFLARASKILTCLCSYIKGVLATPNS